MFSSVTRRVVAIAAAGLMAVTSHVVAAQATPAPGPAQAVPMQSKSKSSNRWHQSFTAAGITSRYHVIVQDRAGRTVDWNRRVGLVVYLHGDGAGEYDGGRWAPNTWRLVDDAIDHNMIVLMPRTPDGTTDTWWINNTGGHRKWLTELVEKMLRDPAYRNLNPGDMTWMGFSGGAEFLSYEFIPNATKYITSGALMVGGGGAGRWMGDITKNASERQLNEVPLAWVVGSNDSGLQKDTPEGLGANGFNAVRAGENGFDTFCNGPRKRVSAVKETCTDSADGFTEASREVLPGKNHYDLDHGEILGKFLKTRSPGIRGK